MSPSILSKDSSGKVLTSKLCAISWFYNYFFQWRFIGCHSYIPEQNWRFVKSSASVSVYIKRFTDVCMAAQGLNPQDFSVTGKKGPGEAVAKPAIPQSAMSQIKGINRFINFSRNYCTLNTIFYFQHFFAWGCLRTTTKGSLSCSPSRVFRPSAQMHHTSLTWWLRPEKVCLCWTTILGTLERGLLELASETMSSFYLKAHSLLKHYYKALLCVLKLLINAIQCNEMLY